MKESAAVAGQLPVRLARSQLYYNDADLGNFIGSPGTTALGSFVSVEGFTEATVQALELLAGDAAPWLQLGIGWANENDALVNLTTVVGPAGSGWVGAGVWGADSFTFARSTPVSRRVRLVIKHTNAFAVDSWQVDARLFLRGRPVFSGGFLA